MISSRPKQRAVAVAAVLVSLLVFLSGSETSLQAATVTCPMTVSVTLVLSEDLVCQAGFTGTALIVGAHGITLDGAGNIIVAPDASVVIQLTSRSGVTIRDLNLSGSGTSYGVRVDGGGGNVFSYVNASGPGSYGFFLSHSPDNTIEHSTANNRSIGVYLAGASGGTLVQQNNLAGNGHAIYSYSNTGQGNWYLDNDVSGTGNYAVVLANDNLFRLERNNFAASARGIQLVNLDGVSLEDVDLSTVESTSLQLTGVTGSSFTRITANGGGRGVDVSGGGGNVFSYVNASGPGSYGFFLSHSPDNNIEHSTANSRSTGVYLAGDSGGTLIQQNNLAGNTAGVYVMGNNNHLTCNTINGNQVGVQVLSGSGSVVSHNQIEGNTQFGLRNDSVAPVNAENNYWGALNGPYPIGSGDAISANVDAEPFATDSSELDGPCGRSLIASIDIKPGTDTNPVNPKSKGMIPVAILSSAAFDAPAEVDKASLTFGSTGDEQSLSKCAADEDVNDEGRLDVLCHYWTQAAGFQEGDTMGVLRGRTKGGKQFEGSDRVEIVPGTAKGKGK